MKRLIVAIVALAVLGIYGTPASAMCCKKKCRDNCVSRCDNPCGTVVAAAPEWKEIEVVRKVAKWVDKEVEVTVQVPVWKDEVRKCKVMVPTMVKETRERNSCKADCRRPVKR